MARFYREPDGALVAGVSTGIAAGCDCSPWLVRMGWVLAGLVFTKITLLTYLLLALLVPARQGGDASAKPDTHRASPDGPVSRVQQLEDEFRELEKRLGNS